MSNKTLTEYVATGRRKSAVASVRLRPGKGDVNCNGETFEKYFPLQVQRNTVLAALKQANLVGHYDVIVRLKGGGIEGQAEAARLGIARALVKQDETRRHDLKVSGFLKRDPRKKERKKYGRAGARKSFQFSKR